MNTYLLQTYLSVTTACFPAKTAVTDGADSLSYQALSVLSNKLAHSLSYLGVKRQGRVLVVLPRSAYTIAAILGVLKADAAYVPIDYKSPIVRWGQIVEDVVPDAAIVDSTTATVVAEALRRCNLTAPMLSLSPRKEIPNQDFDVLTLEEIESFSEEEPHYTNTSNDVAYILYTSGSTGQPKGVMISHANVSGYIEWAVSRFQISANDNILGTAPFHFDMSAFDIYCSLKSGATLCLANDMQTLFPEKLVTFIEQQQVTLWKGVSSLLMYMARSGVLKWGRMPTLRRVLFAGETLAAKYLSEWMGKFPGTFFYNAYGPTEATGVSVCYQVESVPGDSTARIPIGSPRQGTSVYLLDDELMEVSVGEVGEICIAGDGLASGYLNDREKTDNAFIVIPQSQNVTRVYRSGDLGRLRHDGNLEYLGRKDRQLKFMGYRIEAGEVERALMSIDQVKESVVDLVESNLNVGVLELVAFLEADGEVDVLKLSRELKMRLPAYMVPRRFVRVNQMPRCERGKLDLRALRQNYLEP